LAADPDYLSVSEQVREALADLRKVNLRELAPKARARYLAEVRDFTELYNIKIESYYKRKRATSSYQNDTLGS
jgi:hypothetical protein